MRNWRTYAVGIVCLVVAASAFYFLRDLCYDDREEKRQGRRIVDEIKAHEPGIVAY